MTDTTGWTPHTGDENPAPAENGKDAPSVRVLIRGRPEFAVGGGPKESGPSPSTAFVWAHNLEYPGSDVIGWRLESDGVEGLTRYPHVRADMGVGA